VGPAAPPDADSSGVGPRPDSTSDGFPFPARKCRELSYFHRPAFRHTILSMVSDEQIQQWADEAEAGYDVEELKRRGRGRPGRGAEPMQVVAVRLTAEELAAVDAIAERDHISRSEAIRRALAGFAA
jgi:predicted transcriptional regulator